MMMMMMMMVVVMKDLLMQLSVETYSFYFAWKDKKHDKKLFSSRQQRVSQSIGQTIVSNLRLRLPREPLHQFIVWLSDNSLGFT